MPGSPRPARPRRGCTPTSCARATGSAKPRRPERARTMPSRIGLFGGSFDPPHLGHLALAVQARDELALDDLCWVPAGQPWQKARRTLAPADDRLAMVRLLIEGQPRMR